MRIHVQTRLMAIASWFICLGVLSGPGNALRAQTAALVRIPAIDDRQDRSPIELTSLEDATKQSPWSPDGTSPCGDPRIARLPIPVGPVAPSQVVLVEPRVAPESNPVALRPSDKPAPAQVRPQEAKVVSGIPLEADEDSRSGFKTIVREGEAPAEPGFPAFLARREPRPPGFEMPSGVEPQVRVAHGVLEPTCATPAPETPILHRGEVRAEQDIQDNRIAQPLSGQFDFEQPMEAIEVTHTDESQLPPFGRGGVSLPKGVEARAHQLLQSATSLADRGAIYAANREFLRVMRMITQSLDSQVGRQYHTRALAAGLRALEEADDFSLANGDRVEDDMHLANNVKGHRTPVLKEANFDQMTPLRAIQRYYEYARQQLTISAGNTPMGSQALYALGRGNMVLSTERASGAHGAPRSIAYFDAALAADPNNVRAGNELAVMLARRGRWQDAAHILQGSMRVSTMPVALNNLASIFERLSDPRASTIRHQASQLAARGAVRPPDASRVTWVDPATFAASHHLGAGPVELPQQAVGNVTWTAPQGHIAPQGQVPIPTRTMRATHGAPLPASPSPAARNVKSKQPGQRRGPWW
jgi:hypothetical protein